MPAPEAPELVARLRAAGCVFAEEEADLLLAAVHAVHAAPDEAADAALEALVRRREAGEPLEHLVGWAEFAGHRITVEPGVFIPRPRSEHLVDLAVAATPRHGTVLDLCCGSGALGLAIATRVPSITLHAVDLDPVAVACAHENLAGRGTAYVGDLVAPLPGGLQGRVDVVVANVPYVPDHALSQLPVDARDHEPTTALAGGPDGLDVLRRVAAAARGWLAPGGHLFSEVSTGQGRAAVASCAAAGLAAELVHATSYDATAVVATAPGARS